jgi:folate-binding protein YgfZ
MTVLPYLSLIRFSDADAGDFLHNQLSSDVLGLASGDSIFACYCEPKGRVLALMLVCRVEDAYYVIMSSSLVTTVVNRLKIYVMRSKVSIDVLDEFAVSASSIDEVPEIPSPVPAIPLPDNSGCFLATEKDKTPDGDTSLQDNWKISELQRGVVWLGPESSAQFLPQMLGYDALGAINFRKGCYPGQEIVARTHYLGKVKRHPRVLNVSTAIHPDALDSVQISSAEETHKAVVVDCVSTNDATTLFVVTRMDPDQSAEQIEFQDQLIPLI